MMVIVFIVATFEAIIWYCLLLAGRSNYAVHTCRTSSSKSSVNSRQRISHSSSSSNHDDTLTSTSTLASTPGITPTRVP